MKIKKILILSYYAQMPGACQAEWLDDKVDSFIKLGCDVSLVSSICCQKFPSQVIKHIRVPSISYVDFCDELSRIKADGRPISFSSLLMWPIVITMGILFDGMQRILTGGVGEGRWSWTFSSGVAAFLAGLGEKPDLILSTGGPASAHLSGMAVAKLLACPIVVELQDPLSGADIGRNERARGLLFRVEKIIVRFADKVVYVTEAAADFASKQFKSPNISFVYPGARDFDIKRGQIKGEIPKFRLVHLGSLYATRNFRSIVAALDNLIALGRLSEETTELINLGHVSKEIYDEIIVKKYVKILPPIPRIEALEFAANCDLLLLIQNSDDRSWVTIPYKTYDYLNLQMPLLALLNSRELTKLILDCGQMAVSLTEIDGIMSKIIEILENEENFSSARAPIDAVHQAGNLIEVEPQAVKHTAKNV